MNIAALGLELLLRVYVIGRLGFQSNVAEKCFKAFHGRDTSSHCHKFVNSQHSTEHKHMSVSFARSLPEK
jgi:hypothetical protein